MPELPEVEATRRGLEPHLVSRRITKVEVARERMLRRQPVPSDFSGRLLGARINRLRRHGKFLLFDLDNDVVWVTHLGMSGRISVVAASEERPPHANVVISLDSGEQIRLIDPRTFGFVAAYLPDELLAGPIGSLGPDAFEDLPTAVGLERRLRGRTAPIKPLLLDQRIVAGIGNIYADEALYRAKIHPRRQGGSLDREELKALRRAIKATLADGLRWGGTSLDDLAYLLPDGRAGEYLARLRAYGREDEPCPRCGHPIVREVLRQRSTYYCDSCQK